MSIHEVDRFLEEVPWGLVVLMSRTMEDQTTTPKGGGEPRMLSDIELKMLAMGMEI